MPEHILYRKYRSQKFSELRGQNHIVKTLEGAIKANNVAHAYLFFGTRGTGKTSAARIFAAELGTKAVDIYEIDAASYTGVDNIRELNDSVQTLPLESKYKVYIIDEVHMLSKSAFNALLKTLEEPPAHVIFILATTELHKVIDTVVSRCQVLTFKTPTQQVLKEFVSDIAKEEDYEIDGSAAELLALLGNGSFRDTLGVLQKVISSSTSKKLISDEISQITGAPEQALTRSFLEALAENTPDKALELIQLAVKQNIDIETFILIIMHKVRLIMLLRYAKNLHSNLQQELSEDDFNFLNGLAGMKGKLLNAELLTNLIDIYQQTRQSYIKHLPLELLLLRSSG